MRRRYDIEGERVVHVFLVTVLLSISLGALVGAGLGRAILIPPARTESR